MSKGAILVAIVDADSAYVSLLKPVLEQAPAIGRVSAGISPEEVVADLSASNPDVVLIDTAIQDRDAAAVIRDLKTRWPTAAVVALTSSDAQESIAASLQAGASGYLLKSSSVASISDAVEEAAAGGCPLSPLVGRKIAAWFHGRSANDSPAARLTPREREIVTFISRGATNRDVAISLGLSEATVRAHLRRMYEKLNVHSRAEVRGRRR